METNLNALKQPEPSVVSGNNNEKTQKRVPLRPNVGIVDAPNISKTPISDVLELKRQENPHTVYQLSQKPKNGLKFHAICSIAVTLCSILSLIGLFKKNKK